MVEMQDQPSTINRRRFLKQSIWGMGLGMSWPAVGSMAAARPIPQTTHGAEDGPVIVFQGDSITDAGRSKDDQSPNAVHSLGHGYAALAAAHVLGEQPSEGWQCYNRGISGHKVPQLADRWDTDCLDLAPDVLSILIGVNDFWHTLAGDYQGTAESYERDYRALLDRTRDALPDVTLLIGEPFAVPGGSAIGDEWTPAFEAYRTAARRIADDYEATWIPYQSVFEEALTEAPVDYWAPDGVHPSPAGNYRMAQAWLDAFASSTE